jgi:hypothetical protein
VLEPAETNASQFIGWDIMRSVRGRAGRLESVRAS